MARRRYEQSPFGPGTCRQPLSLLGLLLSCDYIAFAELAAAWSQPLYDLFGPLDLQLSWAL